MLKLAWMPADPYASNRPSGEAYGPGGLHSPAFAGHRSPTHQVQLTQLWRCLNHKASSSQLISLRELCPALAGQGQARALFLL